MPAINQLPDNYHLYKSLNLSKGQTMLWLNIAGLVLLVVFGWFFRLIISYIHPINLFHQGILGFLTYFSGLELLALPLSLILMLVLHEVIHGLFFWLFTHQRPRFALRSGYAYAAAPDWYLEKPQYIIVGLAPLVILSFASIILSWLLSSALVPYLFLIATFNAAGSLGDIIVVGWVSIQHRDLLVKDEGDIFKSFIRLGE